MECTVGAGKLDNAIKEMKRMKTNLLGIRIGGQSQESVRRTTVYYITPVTAQRICIIETE